MSRRIRSRQDCLLIQAFFHAHQRENRNDSFTCLHAKELQQRRQQRLGKKIFA